MKKTTLVLLGLFAAAAAHAQTETGTSAGERALDESRSGAISSAGTPAAPASTTVAVTDGKSTAVVEETEADKWWSVNAGTGWDSLYMFRGVNVLGNGNGIYWLNAGLGVSPWENGTFTANFWYGVGSWWNGANAHQPYGEIDVTLGYAHEFGPLTLSAGWIYYSFPNVADVNGNTPTSQNEIYFGAAYEIELGKVTITPNSTFYYNLGPEWGKAGGLINGGSSYWSFGLSSSIPLAYDGAVSLAPYTQFNLNFRFNQRANPLTPFSGGNNWQSGIALPIQFTSWFSVSPYVAYSWTWQNLASPFGGVQPTSANTWWGGISANFSY
ncbi:MAG: hypothetical protein FGM15_01595 [Chthoniobacterales bacterium]|nr:hypothetical protein [Chthoniobacterales bacterium]